MNGTDPTLELLWKKIGADTIASLDEFTKDMQDSQDLRRSVWKKIGADKIDSFEQFEKDFGFVTDAEPQPVEPKKQAYEFDWKAAAKKDLSQSHLQFSPKGSIQEYGVNSQGRLIDKQARPKTEKSLSDIAALNPNTPFGQQFGSEADPLQQYKTINETQKLAKGFKTKQKEIEHFKQSIGDNPSEADIVELNKQVLELLSNYEDNKDFLKEAVNTLNEQSDLKKEKALSLIPAKEFYNNNFAKTFDGPLASLSGDFAEWMTDSKQQELFKGWSTDPDFNAKKKGFVIQQFINSKQKEIEAGIESAKTEEDRDAYVAYQNLLNSSYATFLKDNPKERERLIKQIEKQRELQVQPEDSALEATTKTVKAGLKSAYNTGVNLLVDTFVKLPKYGTDLLRGAAGVDINATDTSDRFIEWTNNLVDNVTFDLPNLKDDGGLDSAGAAATITNVIGSLLGLRAVAGALSKVGSARALAALKGIEEVQRAAILARAEKFQKGEQFLAGLMIYAPRTIESYKEQGLSDSDALSVGLLSSGISSVIEMISPGIPFGTSLTKDAYLKLAKEGATKGTILKEIGKGLFANNVNEIGEELLDDWLNQVILPTVYNDISGQNLKETSLSEYINEDALNTMFITAVATGIFGGALTVGSGQFQEIDGFVDAVKNIDTRIVTEKIQNWVESGQITTEQGSDFLQFIQKQKSEVAKNEGLEASKTTVEQKKPVEKVATGQQVVEDQELTGTEAGQPPTGTIATKTGGEGEIDPTLETESLLSNEQPISTTQSDIKDKKADIEKRRQEALDKANKHIEKTNKKEDRRVKVETYRTLDIGGNPVEVEITINADGSRVLRARQVNEDGSIEPMAYVTERINNKAQATLTNEKLIEGYIGNEENTLKRTNIDENPDQTAIDKINAKYDAALTPEQKQEKKVEVTTKALEGVQRENVDKFVSDFANIDIPFRQENIQAEMDSAVKKQLFPNEKTRRKYAETIYSAVVRSSNFPKILSEAYHKAKADGSNPELVKAVESLLSKDQPTQESGNEGEQKPTASDVLKQESQVKTDGTDTKKQVEEKTAEKAEEKVIYTSTSATLPHRIIERNGERVVQQKSKGEWKDVKNKQISEAVLENFGLKPEPKKEDKEESFNDAFEKALKEQGGVVSDIDITKRNLDAKGTTNYNKIVPRTKVQKAVMGTIKKLASKLIGVKTYVHESIDSYANALSEAGYPAERAKSSNAFYDGKSIHVFLGSPGLKNNTFLHEGVHAVISAKLKENRAVLTKWVSQLYTDSALFRKYFTEYAGREYDSKSLDPALVDEEAVTEFLADKVFEKMLEDANTDRNLFDNLKEWFRNLLRRLGYKADVINPVLSTDEDVFSFADRLADLFKTSAVQTTDINKGTIRFQDEGDFSQAELNNKKERLRTTIRNKIPEINSGKIPHNAIIASAKKQGIPEEETLEILKQEIYGFTPDVTRLVHAETKAILKKIGTKTESEKTGLEDRVYQAIQRGLITDNSFEGIEAVLAQKELNGGRINGVEITALQYAQQQVQEAANEVDNKMTEARNSWTKSYGIENDLGYRALENEFRFLNFLKIDLLAHSIQVGSQKGADLQSLQQYLTDAQKYAKKLLSRMVDKITPKEKAEFGAKATEVEKASEQYAKALEKSQTDKDQKLKSGAEKEVSEQSKKSGKKTKYDDLTTDELDKRISKLLEGNDLLEGTVLFQDNDEKPNGGGDLNKNIELYKLLRARANKVIKELQKKGTFPTADEVYLKMKDLFPKLSKDAFYKAMVFGSEGAINEATKYAQRERANLTNFIKRKLKADLLAKAKMEKLLRGEKLTPEDEEQYSKAATDALNMALQIGLSTNELLQLSEDLNKLNLALDKSRAADMAAKEIKAALAKIDDEITKRAENRKKNYEKKLKDIQERLDKLANGDPDGLDGLVVPNQDKLVSFELTQARKRYQNEREKLFVFANYLEHKDRIDKANTVLGKMYQHYMAQGGKKALASSLFEVSRSMKAMFDLSSFFVQAIGWTVPSAIPGIRVLNTKGLNKDEIRTLQNKSLSKWSLHLGGNVFANWNIPITANAFRNAVDIIAKGLSIKKDSFKLAAIRHNEDIKSTVFYDLAERAGVDLSEVGDISQREDFFHSDFFKTMANLPTSTFSENKKAGGLLKAIWKQTGTTAVTAAKGIQLVKEISEEIYIYSLNEFKVNQFRQTVMAAGAINDLDYQKFIARQINIQFGTAKIASSDESALTFLDNNFWKYVFFAPHLFMNRIRQVFNYGTSPVRLAAGVITGNKKAQKEEAYKIIHTTKALASYGALMYLAELLGLEWDDDPRSSTFMKLKYGDKTLDMTGGFAPIWKMFGRTTYYAGQNEKTPGKAIRSVVGPIMKYMPFIGVEDYFTSDVPASLKGSLAMSNFRDEYVRFLTYKLHPSVSLGVVTGANYFATGDLTDAIGKPIYSEIVAQLGGDPSGWLSTTLGMASHMFMPIFLDQLSDDILKYTDKKPETFDDYVYSFWGNGMFAFMGANTTDYEDLMKAQEIQNYFDSSKVFNGRNPFKMLRFEDLKIYDGGATKKVPDWMLNNTIYKSMLKDYAKAYYAEDLQQRIKAGTSPKEMERLIFGQNGIRKKAMRKAVNEIERQYGKDNKPK